MSDEDFNLFIQAYSDSLKHQKYRREYKKDLLDVFRQFDSGKISIETVRDQLGFSNNSKAYKKMSQIWSYLKGVENEKSSYTEKRHAITIVIKTKKDGGNR